MQLRDDGVATDRTVSPWGSLRRGAIIIRGLGLIVALILGSTDPGRAQVVPKVLVVPESNRPPLIDGFFSGGEWGDAAVLDGNESLRVLVKSYGSDVYLGVKCLDLEIPVIDLFLRPGEGRTYHLHVSSFRADGIVSPADPDQPYLRTTAQFDWEANEVAWDRSKRDSLLAMDIRGQEMLKRAVNPLQGFEFRIGRDQFKSGLWAVLVELQAFAGDEPKIVFPPKAGWESGREWLLLGVR